MKTRLEFHTLLADNLKWRKKSHGDPFGSFLTSALVMSEEAGRFHAFILAHNKPLRGVQSEKGNRTQRPAPGGKTGNEKAGELITTAGLQQ